MSGPWTPWRLGSLEVPNRLVRSATWEGLAGEDGRPRPELAEMLGRLSQGGAGMVVAGFAYVDPRGKALIGQTGACDDALLEDLAALAEAIRRGGARSCLQIGHCGAQLWRVLAEKGIKAEGPSAAPGVEEMTLERIRELIRAFGEAARRVKEAGFDAVQLHCAHGYLLGSFLSPRSNRRSDEWGGNLEGRARFPLEVYRAVRAAVGPDYPVWAKWNGRDYVEGGLEAEESLEAAALLVEEGLDGIEVSGGVLDSGDLGTTRGPEAEEGYFLEEARAFAERLSVPVGTVGGIRSMNAVERILGEGLAFVSLSRPLIREPDLPKAWRSGEKRTADCVSCNRCFVPALRGKGIRCMGPRRRRG